MNKANEAEKVVGLFGAIPTGINQPDQDIISRLEELLDLAKNGQLQGFACALVFANGGIRTGWDGRAERHLMLAGTNILHNRMIKAIIEEDDI